MNAEAARCVKCGLCLAQCPTYQLSANEAMSPRGRIALIQALETGQVSADGRSHEVLNSCLLCRRCETQCPSDVPFARIMDQGRILTRHQQRLADRIIAAIASRPRMLRIAVGLGKAVLPRNSRLGRILCAESPVRRLSEDDPDSGNKPLRGRVGLFTGCSGRVFDQSTIDAAKLLLRHAGYDVMVPDTQVCCGAIDAHSGNVDRANLLVRKNQVAFAAMDAMDAVVSIATGCGAQLEEYSGLGSRHEDICGFLAQSTIISALKFKPLQKRVALHLPCTQVNVLGGDESVVRLLEKIPGLSIELLGKKGGCCGAGGTAFLNPSAVATSLGKPLQQQIEKMLPDYVLSANISCRLHLKAGVSTASVQYMHPITLLAQQLIRQ